jgi:hypothetical protein
MISQIPRFVGLSLFKELPLASPGATSVYLSSIHIWANRDEDLPEINTSASMLIEE